MRDRVYGTCGHAERAHDLVVPVVRARGSRGRVERVTRHGKCHPRGGRGAPTCAPSVGCGSRGLGVIVSAKKKRFEARATRRLHSDAGRCDPRGHSRHANNDRLLPNTRARAKPVIFDAAHYC